MEETEMKIGIALITESPFFEEIVKIENEVHDICGFSNKLEVYNNIPHTTLFHGTFQDDTDYEFILHKLKNYYMEKVQGKRQLQKIATREHIIETAMSVYIAQGFSVPTHTIAQKAGVAHGTIFVHFPTREALLFQALARFADDIGNKLHGLSATINYFPVFCNNDAIADFVRKNNFCIFKNSHIIT